MKSGEIIRITGITRDTLRHYLKVGLLNPKINSENGYKVYSQKDLEMVSFIKSAKGIGFTLSEIKKLSEQMSSTTCKHRMLLPYLRDQLNEVHEKILSLKEIEKHLNMLVEDFEQKNCEEHYEDLNL